MSKLPYRLGTFLVGTALYLGSAPLLQAQRPSPVTPGLLRVCADPDNLPFSNAKGEGMENKIAELLAREWHSKLEYAWWPIRRGFFSRALNGMYCDVALSAPVLLDMAGVTRPYFRSAYVAVSRKDSGLDIKSLDDPVLKKLRIGVNLLQSDAENTPPAMALSAHGVVGTLIGFETFYSDSGDRPQDIINAVADRKIDLAIVWGPLAGYWAKKASVPMVLNPLPDDSVSEIPFQFSIGMATRRRDRELRDSLQKFIDMHRPQLTSILEEFSVPLLPLPADSARPVGTAGPGAGAARPR